MSRKAVPIALTEEERSLLERRLKARTAAQRDVLRARIVLLAAIGKDNQAIAKEVGLSAHSVAAWRRRFAEGRVIGLADRPRKRTPIKYTAEDRRRVLEMACDASPGPERTVRALAEATGVGRETVRAVLREASARPYDSGTLTRSRDPKDVANGSSVDRIVHSPTGLLRAVEMRWVEEHTSELKQFAGEWVVVEGERLVAHGASLPEAVSKARSLGTEIPYAVRIPEDHEAPFVG